MNIYQLLPTIAYGDAVGNDTIALEKVIKRMGYNTRIFAASIAPPYDKTVAGLVEQMPPVNEEDIIIYHLSTGNDLNFKLAEFKCRKILIYHNITPAKYFGEENAFFKKISEDAIEGAKFLSDKVDYCLAVSDFNKSDLIDLGYKCPIDVLPIIIPMGDYEKKPDKAVMKELSDGVTNILFTGRVVPNKKHEDLIAAFYYYKKLYNPKSRLILAGSYKPGDTYYVRLKKYMERLGIREEDVIFSGHKKFNAILAYYRSADVFLCMSEHEGFCVPLVEAMLFDVPIIARDTSAIGSTLGGSGMLIDTNNPVEVAACIDRVVKDKDLREKIIKAQQARRQDFQYEKIASQFEKLLKDFIDKV